MSVTRSLQKGFNLEMLHGAACSVRCSARMSERRLKQATTVSGKLRITTTTQQRRLTWWQDPESRCQSPLRSTRAHFIRNALAYMPKSQMRERFEKLGALMNEAECQWCTTVSRAR